MGKLFDPSAEELRYLLESIQKRDMALPDFQRDFVWKPRDTEQLIESMCQNFPAGSLLRIRNSKSFYFAPRQFAGAPPLNGHEPFYLVLDGQQRLTSLYQALFGAGDHCYFINLKDLIGGEDLEDSVFYTSSREARKKYDTLEQQAAELVFPLKLLFGTTGGFLEWFDAVLDLRTDNQEEKETLKPQLRATYRQWIKPLEDYKFPMVTLESDISAEAVCTIFEKLNSTGVKLSVYDLLAARFWPQELPLRDWWEKAKNDHRIIHDFEVDPYYVLQSIALFAHDGAPSCKRKDVLELKKGQIKKGWAPVVQALTDFLTLLREDCGVIVPEWLPYDTILVPAAAAMASLRNRKGPDVAAVRRDIKRWFWCSVFGQAYEKSPNSQAAKDYRELLVWVKEGKLPQVVKDFSFKPETLREITPRQQAVYRGAIALILRNGAKDFHTSERITAAVMRAQKIDDHHIFPRAFLHSAIPQITDIARDCVLNRTLLGKETDIRIGKKAPSDYLKEIEVALGKEGLKAILESHLLPSEHDSPLWHDQFAEFLELRQQQLGEMIREVTQ